MKAFSREEAVKYAELILAAEDSTSPERTLARYVLALETIVESFVQDAERATEPQPELILDAPCGVCGWRVMDAADLSEVLRRHDELVERKQMAPHAPTLEQAPGRWVVVTTGTIREVEHPSGEVTDRDATGGNDPYSNA